MANEVTVRADSELIPVLQSSLYPGASRESCEMVLAYCRAAGLDPMLKPVHIVPIWDGKAKSMRDVVMPGIGLYRIQASRTGEFAGMSEPEFGPDVTEELGGVTITYPQWARVTVDRLLPGGKVAHFTAVERWRENYAPKGGPDKSQAPNAMWTRRPYGQLGKCAQAQALRIAFPELGAQATAEEMEGKTVNAEDVSLPNIHLEPCPPELLNAAHGAAAAGERAYQTFFQETGKDNRKRLAPYHDELRQKAVEADKSRTVDPGAIDDAFGAAAAAVGGK